jgi:phosphate transport system permease protein
MARKKRPPVRLGETAAYVACWVSAALAVLAAGTIVAVLVFRGVEALSVEFFLTDPLPSFEESLSGGARAPMVGSLLLALLSLAAVVIPSLASAIYLAEYMDETKLGTKVIRLGLEVLAGVPSVVFGIWGLAFFSNRLFTFLSSSSDADPTLAFGRSFIIGSLVMAVHVLPFVVKVMEESLRSVPTRLREAAAALGLTKWRTIRRVVLPTAAPGLITALVLGLGLVIGDTAIVWLTVGGTMSMSGAEQWWLPQNWWDVLTGTGSTLTTFVYYSSPAGEGNSPGKAYAAALVLVLMIIGINALIATLGKSRTVKES